MNMEEVRQELTAAFPQWFISAAEHNDVSLGHVMKFSPTRWFFPDCSVDYTDYGERIYQVFLLVDIDSALADLLARPPGSFHYPGVTLSLPGKWEELNITQIRDCLWHALDEWFTYFDYRVAFDINWAEYNRGQVPGDLRVGCQLEGFSARHNIQFLHEPDAEHS